MTGKLPNKDAQAMVQDASLSMLLSRPQIEMIDEALSSVGEFGEVHLIVQKGRLRFVVTQSSLDALNWLPGSLESDGGLRRKRE